MNNIRVFDSVKIYYSFTHSMKFLKNHCMHFLKRSVYYVVYYKIFLFLLFIYIYVFQPYLRLGIPQVKHNTVFSSVLHRHTTNQNKVRLYTMSTKKPYKQYTSYKSWSIFCDSLVIYFVLRFLNLSLILKIDQDL